MKKYGIEHFHIELVEETDNPNEREQYWIQYYNSYHYGYNATLGGDGKKYIDYNLVITTYNQLLSVKETATKLNISPDSVSNILHQNNISVKTGQQINAEKNSKCTNMYSLDGEFLQSFPSAMDAGRYLIENHLSNCKLSTIRQHISEVCRGKRKTAAGFKWQFVE